MEREFDGTRVGKGTTEYMILDRLTQYLDFPLSNKETKIAEVTGKGGTSSGTERLHLFSTKALDGKGSPLLVREEPADVIKENGTRQKEMETKGRNTRGMPAGESLATKPYDVSNELSSGERSPSLSFFVSNGDVSETNVSSPMSGENCKSKHNDVNATSNKSNFHSKAPVKTGLDVVDPLHASELQQANAVKGGTAKEKGILNPESAYIAHGLTSQDKEDYHAWRNMVHQEKKQPRISELRNATARRHTSPVTSQVKDDISISLKRSSEDPRIQPVTRSTFPSIVRNRTHDDVFRRRSHESTNSEINRMKNSILVQRNLRKRKNVLDDDKVLIGNKITEGHDNFVMAYNMLTGIRVAVSRCSGIMRQLNAEDFKTTKKLSFNIEGNELTPSSKYDFKFKDYCPEVFRDLRSIFGIDPADYLMSVTGKYILSELGSPGKSGSFFYYSRDYRFIIKTIHHSEHKQLLKILKDYHEHVKANPNTLISQFYGLHRVKMPYSKQGIRKVHFVVMNNLFPPHRDIHLKYDLKGSTFGRKFNTDSLDKSDLSKVTLKDLNWVENKQKIKFGPEKRKLFLEQLERDVLLLKKINVMDYSLLLGVHDVKTGNTKETMQRLSIFDPISAEKRVLMNTNPRGIDLATYLPNNYIQTRMQYIFYGHDGGIRATDERNDPLSEIYYLGIIDCLTNYSLKKKLETVWRSLGHNRSTISSLPAKEYGDRFLNFIKNSTTNVKAKSQ